MLKKFHLENLKERSPVRHRHRWEDDTKTYVKEIGCKDVVCIWFRMQTSECGTES